MNQDSQAEAERRESFLRRARIGTARLFRSRWVRLTLAAAIIVVLVLAGLRFWNYFESYVSTDDAEVAGYLLPVSARIQGKILKVLVDNTRFVEQGQQLVTLDPTDYRVALAQAKAALDEAQAQAVASHSDYLAAQANVREALASNVKAQADLRRYTALLKSRVVPRESYDTILSTARVAAATVDSDRATLASAGKAVAVREAAVAAAKAALDQATLNLTYTVISSPADGIVGNRTAQVGEYVQAGQGLMTVTDVNHLWIVANFKESYFGAIKAGQRATVHVDALNRDLDGTVSGLGGATGALYSLLPPENATGNWIKIVQRLPVRIDLTRDNGRLPAHLRPGESVEVKIWLR